MKKLILSVIALMASVMVGQAQTSIMLGVMSFNADINTEDVAENFNGVNHYYAGIAYKASLPFGLALQPELVYHVKGAEFNDVVQGIKDNFNLREQGKEFDWKNGFAEIGVGVQWGPDFYVVRPFAFLKPFAGINVADISNPDVQPDESGESPFVKSLKNGLEYGISIGLGIDFFERVQLSLELYKNLGKVFEDGKVNASAAAAAEGITDINSYGGAKITLGIFF